MSDRIVCKPTPWFLLRAALMLAMFGVFSVLFFVDGKWGYRNENLSYYVWQGFDKAAKDFAARESGLTPEAWQAHAATQTIDLPEDRSILPPGTPDPMPWPAVLQDFEKMKATPGRPPELKKLFDEYRKEADIRRNAPEKAFDAGKIREQWWAFGVCLALTSGAAFILLRTLRRSISVDDEALYPATGGRIPFGDLVRLDLRKWDTKGLAYAWAKTGDGGEKRLRIDGLTYGGFKKEQDEPAERLMRRLREHFSGEIVEYVIEEEPPKEASAPEG